jgi:hypothetical protein
MRTIGTLTNRIPSVVSIVSPLSFLSLLFTVSLHVLIDSPELGPGSILGPSSVSVTPTSSSASPTSSYTRSPTPSPPKSNSSKSKAKQNTAAIAGGVVGGVVAITFAAVAIFFRLRRSSQVPPAVSAAVEVSQPQPPPSDEGALLSLAEPPIPKFYVRDFVACVALVCSHTCIPHTF